MSNSKNPKNNRDQINEAAIARKKYNTKAFTNRISRSSVVASCGESFTASGVTPRIGSATRNERSDNQTNQFQQYRQSTSQFQRFSNSCERNKNNNYTSKNIEVLSTESKSGFAQLSNNKPFDENLLQSPAQRNARIDKFYEQQQQAGSMEHKFTNIKFQSNQLQQQNKYGVPPISESGMFFECFL